MGKLRKTTILHRWSGFFAALLTALLALVYASATVGSAFAQAGPEPTPQQPVINGDRVVQSGETVEGDVNVTNGNLVVYGTIQGNAVVFKGDADIEGTITKNLALLVSGSVRLGAGAVVEGDLLANGDIVLGPHSRVGGNVSSVGGRVAEDPTARVGGKVSAADLTVNGVQNEVVVTPGPEPVNSVTGSASAHGFLPSAMGRMAVVFAGAIASIFLLILGAVLVLLIPRRVHLATLTLESELIPSLIVGTITALLLFPVAGLVGILLTISVVGVFFLPVLVVAVLVGLLFGLMTLGSALGKFLFGASTALWRSHNQSLVLQASAGTAVVLAASVVPTILGLRFLTYLMVFLLYFAACIGLGAVILSRLGTLMPPRLRTASPGPYVSPYASSPPMSATTAATAATAGAAPPAPQSPVPTGASGSNRGGQEPPP